MQGAIEFVGPGVEIVVGPEQINRLVFGQATFDGETGEEGCWLAVRPIRRAQDAFAAHDFKPSKQSNAYGERITLRHWVAVLSSKSKSSCPRRLINLE